MKLYAGILMLIVVLMLAVPMVALAQDGGQAGGTEATYMISRDVISMVIIVVGGVFALFSGLFGGALYALYHSQPKWGQEVTREAFIMLFDRLEKFAALTPTTMDDDAVVELRGKVLGEIMAPQEPLDLGHAKGTIDVEVNVGPPNFNDGNEPPGAGDPVPLGG